MKNAATLYDPAETWKVNVVPLYCMCPYQSHLSLNAHPETEETVVNVIAVPASAMIVKWVF